MHILWQLQLSSVDTSGKLLVDQDSNWSFARNIINGLMSITNDIKISILFPNTTQVGPKVFGNIEASFKKYGGRVKLFPFRYDTNVFSSRFSFDFELTIDMCKTVEGHVGPIDVVWINDPSLVMNWKVVFNELGIRPKIVSYNHWIDNEQFPKTNGYFNYTLRQIEGVIHSDLHLLNSKYASEMLISSFNQYNMEHSYPYHKVHDIPNILDVKFYTDNKLSWSPVTGRFKIIYNHRISSMSYYKEAFDDFIEVCDSLADAGYVFNVVLTNPSGKNLRIDRTYVEVKTGLSYIDYLREICSAHIVASSFRPGNGGMWSSSIMEGLALGVPTLVPKHSGYVEMAPHDYNGLFVSKADLFSKIKMLMNSIEFMANLSRTGFTFTRKNLSPEVVCTKLVSLLEGIK